MNCKNLILWHSNQAYQLRTFFFLIAITGTAFRNQTIFMYLIFSLTYKISSENIHDGTHKPWSQFSIGGYFLGLLSRPQHTFPQNCRSGVCFLSLRHPLQKKELIQIFLSSWHLVYVSSVGLHPIEILYPKPDQYWWGNLESAAISCSISGKLWMSI